MIFMSRCFDIGSFLQHEREIIILFCVHIRLYFHNI